MITGAGAASAVSIRIVVLMPPCVQTSPSISQLRWVGHAVDRRDAAASQRVAGFRCTCRTNASMEPSECAMMLGVSCASAVSFAARMYTTASSSTDSRCARAVSKGRGVIVHTVACRSFWTCALDVPCQRQATLRCAPGVLDGCSVWLRKRIVHAPGREGSSSCTIAIPVSWEALSNGV